MAILIFLEGVNTCGKSVISENLQDMLTKKGYSCENIHEKKILDTFLPDNITEEKNKSMLIKIFKDELKKDIDYIIFDRGYFSGLNYLNINFEKFRNIDNLLAKNGAIVILLHFDIKTIPKRIKNSLKYRERDFIDYYNKLISECKSSQEEDLALIKSYDSSMKGFIKNIEKSKMKHIKIDVTNIYNKDSYSKIMGRILTFIIGKTRKKG
jgi:thymidylate kinase